MNFLRVRRVHFVGIGGIGMSGLAELLKSLTRDSLLAMASRARGLAKPKAAARVADQIEGLVPA